MTKYQKYQIVGLMRKVLIGYAMAGFNGENTATLSMAEFWLTKGGADFDIKIYVNTDDEDRIKAQLAIFDDRLSALARADINITVYTAPSGLPVLIYGAEDLDKEYRGGLVYPMPAVSLTCRIKFNQATKQTLTAISYSRLRYSEGLCNLRTEYGYQRTTGIKQITRTDTPRAYLEFCQQPRQITTAPVRPAFLDDKPYYLLYCNPSICHGEYHRGVTYQEAFQTFIVHSLSNYPDQDITIFQNNRLAITECDFKSIATQLIAMNPSLIIQYETGPAADTDAEPPTVSIQKPGASGPTVHIKLYPRMSNPEFLGFTQQAEIAAVTSSGTGDELFAMGRACLFIDGGILSRIRMLYELIEGAHGHEGSFALLHHFFHLQRHIHTVTKPHEKLEFCTALAELFAPEHREALDAQFKQLRVLLEEKFNLADELHAALDELAVSFGFSPRLFATDTASAPEAAPVPASSSAVEEKPRCE